MCHILFPPFFLLFFPTLGQGGGAWLRTCVFFVFSLAWRKCYTWAHAWPLLLPIIFVYYSPGDKAQKVIPGGSKTNESFWKSQNNIKKSILRFPSFMFTIALVIFVILLETFGTPWKPFGAPLDAKWRWRPSCGVTPNFVRKTSKLAEAFVKKWKGGPQNSSASTIFFEKA